MLKRKDFYDIILIGVKNTKYNFTLSDSNTMNITLNTILIKKKKL